jgi:hypothetical protein
VAQLPDCWAQKVTWAPPGWVMVIPPGAVRRPGVFRLRLAQMRLMMKKGINRPVDVVNSPQTFRSNGR